MDEFMPNTLEGNLVATELKFAFVVSRFNAFICERLLEGALGCMSQHGADEAQQTVVHVPGAFEIPLACQKLAQTGKYDGIVALGAVIRGSTPHFDYVTSAVTSGINQVTLKYDIPVAFGILTTDTIEQAIERAGTKLGNKGAEAVVATIEMANLLTKF